MLESMDRSAGSSLDLVGIIGQVRRRWRMKLAVRGAAVVLLTAAAVFFAAAYGLQWARFSPTSILAARVLLGLTLLASAGWFLVRPLRRRVTDEQVALYLEEHEPKLQATLVSAVEASRAGQPVASSALVEGLIAQAIERCVSADAVRLIERQPIQRYGVALGALALAATLFVTLGPAFLRSALSAILLVSRDVEAAAPYRIEITPGNTTVPKGSDQTISAKLLGFAAADATLMVRRTAGAAFEAMPLIRSESGDFEAILFDVAGPIEYYVEAEGVRSSVYTMLVVDLPYAQRIELELIFPSYTGLEPQTIEDGGDIAALKGTEVRLRVFPTMKTPGGQLALNDKDRVALGAPDADGALGASFKIVGDGFYQIELVAPNGERVAASPRHAIDVLTDQPPTVSFSRPGRDTQASSIEEVFVEASAEDDFGVRDLELVYSVNGGPEKTVKLFGGTGKRLPEVTAGHTFYMEELGVQPGDSVSYFARALDNSGSGEPATSDLYFLRVRPFKQDFRQAQSQGGGGGGGGGGQQQVDALSEQQRQIIAATFNVQRDRKKLTGQKLRESSTVVALSQSRLREQVENLMTRLNSQLVQQDPAFAKIVEMLPQAVEAMKEAEGQLAKASPDAALPPEQKALQVLQKAEEEYQQQVQVQQGGGGGGGGGGSQQQQELADIFDQELDKMASRYETANRATQQNADREVDELLEKLKELARRQLQEAERQRRRALEGQAASGGSSAAQQRALAEQAEEAARRLERLAREENRQDLTEAARQMREAADAMRRAAAGGDANASAQAQRALERLQETEKRLQRGLTDRAERDIQEAKETIDELAREQDEIAAGVRGLSNAGQRRAEEARRINDRKDELEGRLGELESRLDSAARDASGREREASRRLAEAAGAIRNNRLRDKIRYSRALVSRGIAPESLQANENDIANGLDSVKEKLDEAQDALGSGTPEDKRAETLDKARRLARGLESLQERTRERAERQARQQGQQGPGQQGDQQGQEQGQQGQQGDQQGQQGQGQQGRQGQGQQGQQGQQAGQGQGGQQGQGQQAGQGQQGQQGGQGGGQQSGQQGGQGGQRADSTLGGGNNRGGQVNRGGGFNNGAGPLGPGWNGRLTPEDIRQLQAEMRQWSNEAADLRGMIRGEDIDPRELDQILRTLRDLQDNRIYQDVGELQKAQEFVAEGLKRFEFDLRRKLDAESGGVVLSGSDQVPEQFRKLVEQYYRSLARTQR